MIYRTLGKTVQEISVIGQDLDPMFLGHHSPEQVSELVSFTTDNGVNFLSASILNQNLIKEVFKHVDKAVMVSFCSKRNARLNIGKDFHDFFMNLGRKYIDIFSLKVEGGLWDYKRKLEEGGLDVLKDFQKEGLLKFKGIICYDMAVIKQAILSNEFEIVQIPYNLANELAEEIFELAEKHGVGVITLDPLAKESFVNREVLKEKSNLSKDLISVREAIKYILSNKKIHSCLSQMSSIDEAWEMIENGISEVEISNAEKKVLKSRMLKQVGKDFCTSCRYCWPCEDLGYEFNIDLILRYAYLYDKYKLERLKKEYAELKTKANACIKCGKCEALCPYNIPIMKKLAEAHKILS